MIYKRSILALFLSILLFSSCDKVKNFSKENEDIFPIRFADDSDDIGMKVLDLDFAPDYKTFTVTVDVLKDVGDYELADSVHIRPEVLETFELNRIAHYSTPRLLEIRNTEADRIYESGLKMLVLVDLTLPQSELDTIRSVVSHMQTSFNRDNLYIAFMDGDTVSATMVATDYVIDHYFVSRHTGYVRLYRSILAKRDEMRQNGEFWRDAQKTVLLTFSNEKVYHDGSDEPLDPDHFLLQEKLTGRDSSVADSSFYAYYASFNQHRNGLDDNASSILRIFCHSTGGDYLEDFYWTDFKHRMYSDLGYEFPDNEFVFENPDFKVYRGDPKKLTLNFYNRQTDSLIISFTETVTLGEMFNPIIVNGHDIAYILQQGFSFALLFALVLYLVLQFIVPFIRHLVFLRKYVVRYRSDDMSYGNKTVEKSCYLCKAPFKKGDRIVVKCEHTMHKGCWDENGYHCPEYSDRCKHGSHYYNSDNIFDSRNAPYHLKWFLAATMAVTVAWVLFSIYAHLGWYYTFYSSVHSSVTQPPMAGMLIAFFLTLAFSNLVLPRFNFRAQGSILLRSIIAAVLSYLQFLLVNIIIYYFNINRLAVLLNWIPWTVTAISVIECTTYSTRFFRRKWLLAVAVIVGVVSMYAWNFLLRFTELDFRVLLLISFVLYGVGLAACIANVIPQSERYFLKVQGAVKAIDIALYKWFRNNPGRVVTIGKSVDCTLQLSWDIQGDVAPVQAEIHKRKRIFYLIPLEPGVFLRGRPAKPGKKYLLFHGRTFTIGQTTFTYIEKDR